MSIISMKSMLENAIQNKYAVGYFEAWDFESMSAVIDAAERCASPVIIGYNGTFLGNRERNNSVDIELYGAVGKVMAQKAKVPTVLLLNETDDMQMLEKAVVSGFSTVMFDGVDTPIDKLTRINRHLVSIAHKNRVEVEAEVGSLPTADISKDSVSGGELTDPQQAADFVKETGVDALAVAVGNVHLLEKGKSDLDFGLIKQLREKIDVPLVLHGGTGISEENLKKAISLGMCKVNIGTIMKRTYINVFKKYFDEIDTDSTDPHEILGKGGPKDIMIRAKEELTDVVAGYMKVFNSCGKADLF